MRTRGRNVTVTKSSTGGSPAEGSGVPAVRTRNADFAGMDIDVPDDHR
jgi:hypothetical protein